jgi:hypothetical protein
MSVVLVVGYVLPVVGLFAAAAVIAGIVGLSGLTLYESMSERRVAATEVARASL